MGPAVTSTFSPFKSFVWSASSAASIISSTAASLPLPVYPQARSPSSGPTKRKPCPLSFSTLAATIGFAHISEFMEGAMSTVAVVADNIVVNRSSAMPEAALPMRLAVAGATIIRSAFCASSM